MFGLTALLLLLSPLRAADSPEGSTVLVLVGAPGLPAYQEEFSDAAGLWKKWTAQAGAKSIFIGLEPGAKPDRELLEQALEAEPRESESDLWIVLIGHGTFDGKEARFNLTGPDFTAEELAAWLKPFHRPTAIIDASSASGPFLNKLSGPGRVVITATKSGFEANFAAFGRFFAQAVGDPKADLDKDGQTSLLEAFLAASDQVAEYYRSEKRLATEHALLDDNGDGLGTAAAALQGRLPATSQPASAERDGVRANQFHLIPSAEERALPAEFRKQRNALEIEVAALREKKKELSEEAYYGQLEPLLLEIARLYERRARQ